MVLLEEVKSQTKSLHYTLTEEFYLDSSCCRCLWWLFVCVCVSCMQGRSRMTTV